MNTLILDAEAKSITAVMAVASEDSEPDFVTSYADSTSTAFTESANDGTLNGTNAVTIVASPAASTRRIIKSISIQNRDTLPVTITLRYVSAGGTRQIWVGTLQVGDTFTMDGVYDKQGKLKIGGG